MTIAELKEKNITELTKIARTLDLPGASGMRKQDLIFKILQAQSEKEGHIFAEGVLDGLASHATTATTAPNVSVTGPRVDTRELQASGSHHKKRTRAAPVHAELCRVQRRCFRY